MREADVHRVIEESPRIGRMETDISQLRADVSELKTEVHRHGVMLDEQKSSIDRLIEVVLDNSKKLEVLNDLGSFKEGMKDRQEALEDAHRRHVRNRRIHRGIEP